MGSLLELSSLEGTGFRIDYDGLIEKYQQATGMSFTDEARDFYRIVFGYAVKGYLVGRNGLDISEAFQFLEEKREKRTYIDYLDNFNRWLETNTLSGYARLMYYGLLHTFHKRGWPKYIQLDNLRLKVMLGTTSVKTVIRARDSLIEAGFIVYEPGKKGTPSLYSLTGYRK